jgi:hypothetical protein
MITFEEVWMMGWMIITFICFWTWWERYLQLQQEDMIEKGEEG